MNEPFPMRDAPEETWVVPVLTVSFLAGPTPEGMPTAGFVFEVQTEPTEQFPDGRVTTPGYVMSIPDIEDFAKDILKLCTQLRGGFN